MPDFLPSLKNIYAYMHHIFTINYILLLINVLLIIINLNFFKKNAINMRNYLSKFFEFSIYVINRKKVKLVIFPMFLIFLALMADKYIEKKCIISSITISAIILMLLAKIILIELREHSNHQ